MLLLKDPRAFCIFMAPVFYFGGIMAYYWTWKRHLASGLSRCRAVRGVIAFISGVLLVFVVYASLELMLPTSSNIFYGGEIVVYWANFFLFAVGSIAVSIYFGVLVFSGYSPKHPEYNDAEE